MSESDSLETLQNRLAAARGDIPVDLLVTNARLLMCFG
jgi:hypothetical protein